MTRTDLVAWYVVVSLSHAPVPDLSEDIDSKEKKSMSRSLTFCCVQSDVFDRKSKTVGRPMGATGGRLI